jgi:hypothetical protein
MKNFKDYTGLTQEEISIFLGVQRSSWSMFASGKRSLPLQAKLKLNDLLVFLEKNDDELYNQKYLAFEKSIAYDKLTYRHKSLVISLIQFEEKLSTFKKNRNQLLLAIKTVHYLIKENNSDLNIIHQIENRVKNSLLFYSEANLELLKLKIINIQNEISQIELNIKTYKKNKK